MNTFGRCPAGIYEDQARAVEARIAEHQAEVEAARAQLQAAIAAIHEFAHGAIESIDGVEVEVVPLFRWMDGSDRNDYVQRVEPSAQGGAKMATAIVDAVLAPAAPFGCHGPTRNR